MDVPLQDTAHEVLLSRSAEQLPSNARNKRKHIIGLSLLVVAVLAVVLPIALLRGGGSDDECKDCVSTPGGPWPRECVHNVPSGTKIEDGSDTVKLTLPDGTVQHLQDCPHQTPSLQRQIPRPTAAEQYSASLDGGHYYPAMMWYGQNDATLPAFNVLNGDVSVPQAPASTQSQVLFYWYGLEPSDYQTVLQPVLAYNQNSDGTWTMAAWNCCPKGHKFYSEPVTLDPGDVMISRINSENGPSSLYKIAALSKNTGQSTTLQASHNSAFTHPLVAMETYYVTACNQLPGSDTTFGNTFLSPQPGQTWSKAEQGSYLPQCGGGSQVEQGDDFVVNNGRG